MSTVSKIREFKDTIVQQNEMIKSEKQARMLMWDGVKAMYSAMIRYKPEFATNATGIETSSYPDVRAEDLARLQPKEVIQRMSEVLTTLTTVLQENRQELAAVYGEIDGDIDRAMEEFQSLKIQQGNEKKGEVFRSNLVAANSTTRASTPDLVAPKPRDDFGPALPPTPPSAPGKKEPLQPISTGKPKSGTTTLESMFSPTSANKAGTGKSGAKK